MIFTARRVHQLQLTAPSADLVWRGRLLLEDALHTVSLPAADSSTLLFIRHFNVGPIHSGQSAASLSRSLEQKLQQITTQAILGTDPAAAQAAAVFFSDDLSAIAHFTHLLATYQPLTAWFWPHLFTHLQTHAPTSVQWHPHLTPYQTLKHILQTLAAHSLAPFATATVLHQLQQQQSLIPLLAMLLVDDGAKLLAQNNWPNNPIAEMVESERQAVAKENSVKHVISLPTTTPLLHAIQACQWPMDDPRSLWLIAMSLIAQNPTLANQPSVLVARAKLIIFSQKTSLSNSPFPGTSFSPAQSSQADARRQSTKSFPARLSSISTTLGDADPTSHNKLLAIPQPGIHTNYAGLIYLLNLLQHLNLPKYLPHYPDHFSQTLLTYIAHRLQIPATDPILLTCLPTSSSPPSLLLIAWYSALRTWAHRYPRLTLKVLIHRPARLALTPTHLDLTFDLAQVDIRIRKTGLDLNPGWLPWFGKVVQFHYEASLSPFGGAQ